jgi:phage I-like protein
MKNPSNNAPLPEWILLLPAGRVELVDRPEPLQADPESLSALVRAFRSRGVDLVIDYEHQSLKGRQAPAAGWIKDLEAKDDGLWAKVEWTPQAREYLQNREYRYFSPVLQLDPESRRPQALMQVGLTNMPAIKRLPPLVARWKAGWPGETVVLKEGEVGTQVQKGDSRAQGPEMAKETAEIRSFLELGPDAGDREIRAGVLDFFRVLAGTLKMPEDATVSQMLRAVDSLQEETRRLQGVEKELKGLKSRRAEESAAGAVQEAMKAGKITPAQKEWALEYYRQDPGAFETFVAVAPQVTPIGRELHLLKEDGPGKGRLVPEELSLCRSLNLSPEQYLRAKARTGKPL